MTAKGKHPILYVHKETSICSNILIHTHTPLSNLCSSVKCKQLVLSLKYTFFIHSNNTLVG